MGLMKGHLPIAVGLALVVCACGNSTTAPSSSSTTTTPSTTTTSTTPPAVTESWTGTVPVGGAAFYSFSFSQSGTVQLTLQSVSGQYVPPTVMLGLGIGTPDGTSCITTVTTNAQAGSTPQVTTDRKSVV